jgi:hypothetical protein
MIKSFFIVISILLIVSGCSNNPTPVKYEESSTKCGIENINFYRKISKINKDNIYLKNILFDLNTNKLSLNKKYTNKEEIELFSFNDKYSTNEDNCKSADIRYENYLKINERLIALGYNKGYEEFATLLNYNIKTIVNENINYAKWEEEYIEKILYQNSYKKPINIIVYNNTNQKLPFDIEELEVKWNIIKDERSIIQEFKNNLTLIDIEPIPSKEYILDKTFENCNTADNNCLTNLSNQVKELFNMSIGNKNKMIKFEKLIIGSLNKFKVYPYLTSVLGNNILSGTYKKHFLTFKPDNNTVKIYVDIHNKKKIIPEKFRARDYNFSLILEGNNLKLVNKSRSNLIIKNIIITNNNEKYFIDKIVKIPYGNEVVINLNNYPNYINNTYYIFNNKYESFNNRFGLYAEYTKPSYKSPHFVSNYTIDSYTLKAIQLDEQQQNYITLTN